MLMVGIAFIFSLVITASVMPWIIRFSLGMKLYDNLDLYRKNHTESISRLGGIGIFFGYIVSIYVFADLGHVGVHALAASSVIIFGLGLKDDLLGGASPSEKFMVQALAALMLVIFGEIRLQTPSFLPDFFFTRELFVQFFSFIVVLFVVNAFNFIDGVNGLAGMLGVSINLFLGFLLYCTGDVQFAIVAFVIAGATVGFLFFNFIPGRVFMGDSGAMVIGLNTVVICLRFLSTTTKELESIYLVSPAAIVFALLIIPVFDVLRIFLIRSCHHKPLLVGDRNHIHHRLRDLGLKDYQIVLWLVGFTFVTVVISIAAQSYQFFEVVVLLLVWCVINNTILSYLRGRNLFDNYKVSDILFIDTFNKR